MHTTWMDTLDKYVIISKNTKVLISKRVRFKIIEYGWLNLSPENTTPYSIQAQLH